jgi:hypothetical protein
MRKFYLVLLGFALLTPALFAGDHAREHWKHSQNRQHASRYRARAREHRMHERARHRNELYRRQANRRWRDHNRDYAYRRAHYNGGRRDGLPPGIAKRGGDLPPGLQKHIDRTGHLPPGHEKRM